MFLVLIPLSVLHSIYNFYYSPFHRELLRNYLFLDLFRNLLFFMPALFITALGYAVNASFPENELRKIPSAGRITFFIEIAFMFLFVMILLIETLSTTYLYRVEDIHLKDKFLKLKDDNQITILQLEKTGEEYLQDGEYYQALEKYQEALILLPGYEEAEDRIKAITKKLIDQRQMKLEKIKKTGIRSFEEKRYAIAISMFHEYLEDEPEDKEVMKYLNLSIQQTNLKRKRGIKDSYSYKIILNRDGRAEARHKNRIIDLVNIGKQQFLKNDYTKAKETFKKVLRFDLKNYDALHYLGKVNQKMEEIRYFTSSIDKIVRKNLFYINDKYKMVIKEFWKAEHNDYIFFNTLFINLKTGKQTYKKYGYYDEKKKKFIFVNDMIYQQNPLVVDNIDPDIIWYYRDILKDPERFSFYKVITFYKYFRDMLKKEKVFEKMVLIKINYYVLIIFLFSNFLFLFYYLRKKVKRGKVSGFDILFPAVCAIIINKIFLFTFSSLKKIITLELALYPKIVITNVAFFILLFITFLILFLFLQSKTLQGTAVDVSSK